jgi:hypothetical protein
MCGDIFSGNNMLIYLTIVVSAGDREELEEGEFEQEDGCIVLVPPTRQAAVMPKKKRGRKPGTTNKAAGPGKTNGKKVSAPKKKVGRPRKVVSAAKTSKTATPNRAPAEEIFNGEPDEELEGGWPKGWTKIAKKRAGSKHIDRYWRSPGGKQMRSIKDVKRFMAALQKYNGDEDEAFKNRHLEKVEK